MYQKKHNDKRKNSKLITTPKLKKNIFRNSKSKVELRAKINNFMKKEDKNSLANTDINSNLTLLDNKTNSENINYDNSIHNNFYHIEQSTKFNNISGIGVSGVINKKEIYIGNNKLFENNIFIVRIFLASTSQCN